MDPRPGYEDELDELNASIAKRKDILRNDYETAKEPRSMSMQDAFVQGIMQLGPGVLGYALAGTDGGIAGLEGGSAGGDQYLQAVDERLKQEQAQELGVLGLEQDSIKEDELRRNKMQGTVDAYDKIDYQANKSIDTAEKKAQAVKDAKTKYDLSESQAEELVKIRMEAEGYDLSNLNPQQEAELERRIKNQRDPNFRKALKDTVYEMTAQKNVDLRGQGEKRMGRKAKREEAREERSRVVPGLGKANTAGDAKVLKEKMPEYENMAIAAHKLRELVKDNGNIFTGEEFAKMQAVAGNLFLRRKGPAGFNLGSQFTDSEQQMLLITIPNLLAVPGQTITTTELDEMLGRDYMATMELLVDTLDEEFRNNAHAAGIDIPRDYTPLRAISEESLIDRGVPKPKSAPSGVPEKKDLSAFDGDMSSYKKYLAERNAAMKKALGGI